MVLNNNIENNDFSKMKVMGESDIKFIKVASIEKQTPDEYLLRFDVSIDHDPGQFVQVSMFGVGEAPMSICSYSKDYFEMSVRSVGNVSSRICALKQGDLVGIRGPFGNGYPMKDLVDNDVIIIGGGSGTAPVRGIIEYINQNRSKFGSCDLLFGFRSHMDMLFSSDYNEWKENDMTIDIIFSEESKHPIYKKKGMITELLKNKCCKDNNGKIVFVCGPPIMIKFVCEKLLEKGFNTDQIFVSEERHMKCGVGRCGHCMIGDKYCCTDGPVFRFDELKDNYENRGDE